MSNDIVDFLWICVIWVLFVVLIIIFPIHLIEKYVYTPNFGKTVGKPVKYNFWAGGCFVNVSNDNWILCEKYRYCRK